MIDARQRAADARARRQGELQAHARLWRGAWPPARCLYTPEEHALWGAILRALAPAHELAASRRYRAALRRFDLDPGRLPQLATINQTLVRRSGFRMAPAAGYVEPARFFAELSRGVFMATLYLRDPATPLFTPEPDYIHELMGHGIMLADRTYAAISQTLAIAAVALRRMGAAPERLARIERVYWYTMETGLVREDRELRAYGAAVLSSVRELEALRSHRPQRLVLDEVAERPYAYTDLQTDYFYCDDLDRLHDELTAWTSRELLHARVACGRRGPEAPATPER
jgi:phenylalanine-4-hydroxylase